MEASPSLPSQSGTLTTGYWETLLSSSEAPRFNELMGDLLDSDSETSDAYAALQPFVAYAVSQSKAASLDMICAYISGTLMVPENEEEEQRDLRQQVVTVITEMITHGELTGSRHGYYPAGRRLQDAAAKGRLFIETLDTWK